MNNISIGLSYWSHNEKFTEPIKVKIIKSWFDYETGKRFWAIPVKGQDKLFEYLKRNAKTDYTDIVTYPEGHDLEGIMDHENSKWVHFKPLFFKEVTLLFYLS